MAFLMFNYWSVYVETFLLTGALFGRQNTMKVRMALPKAVGYIVVLLVIYYNQGYTQSLNVSLEELMGTKTSHAREKRAALLNSSDYVLQAVINISDLERLQMLLDTLSFPLLINSTAEITSIDTTTVCSSNMGEYQCRCEQGFAWSYNNCISGACDAIINDTCGCITGLPADDQYCQLNTSQTEPVEIDIVLDLRIPPVIVSQNLISVFREGLKEFRLPYTITQFLKVIDINFTTACYPNSTGGLQCQCEEQFAWSCDKCNIYGACSNATEQTCGCINGLPSDGEFCEPITDISQCTTPTPELTPSPSPPNEPVEIDIVLDLRIPAVNVSQNLISIIKEGLKEFPLPYTITQFLKVIDINFTTACYPNSTGGLQCQCEEQFAWSCDKCNIYGACSNATEQTCGCINGLPSDGEFCEPITDISQCPTLTPEQTPSPLPSPTLPNDPVEIDIVIDLRIPPVNVSQNLISVFREGLKMFPLPYTITQFLKVIDINFTTACYPNSTGGLQCQCEEQFAWSCDKCNIYGACSNAHEQTCGCINGLPSDGEFCEPITNISQCPTPTPEQTPSPLPSPTPPNDPVEIDIVLDLRIPPVNVSQNLISVFREGLKVFPLPYTITQFLKVIDINFTTACYPNSTGGLQCQCEEQFAWSCDKCNIYGACSNAPEQTCGCINGLPSDGEFCEPITDIPQCPTPTPGTSITTTTLMTTTTPMTTTTTAMTTTTTPMTTTTTAMTTTTTLMTTTTTLMTTTTTPMTPTTTLMTTTTPMTTTATLMTTTPMTTTTTLMTTTPVTITTNAPNVRNLKLTMNLEYKESFNDITSDVFKQTNKAIQEQCSEHITASHTATLIRFRSGSTIADYTIRATSLPEAEIKAVQTGIFTQLADIYPMIFDSSEPLKLDPAEGFFGSKVTVKCGPPPNNLNFVPNVVAVWTRDSQKIVNDGEHSISETNGVSVLTVSRFFITNNGNYECTLKNSSVGTTSVFRQRTTISQTRPLIQVKPLTKAVDCKTVKEVQLECSVNRPFTVEFIGIQGCNSAGNKITCQYPITNTCEDQEKTFSCQLKNNPIVKKTVTLVLTTERFVCLNDSVFGDGLLNEKAEVGCEEGKEGKETAVCRSTGNWEDRQDLCVLQAVQELLDQSQFLNNNTLPQFLEELSNVTVSLSEQVVESPATITAIVQILNNVANASTSQNIPITETSMEAVLNTTGVLTTDGSKNSWTFINSNDTKTVPGTRSNISATESVSSTLLQSLETITRRLTNDSFNIDTPFILLNKTTFTDTFNSEINSSVEIEIPESDGETNTVTVITFASMDNVLPARDKENSTFNVINGRVVLVQSSGAVNNVSFTFEIINDTLGNPQCVFWNFSLFDGLGGWDDEGCELVNNGNGNVTCNCNHLTSFSILMSPNSPDDLALDVITYIGVGISMASLVICLIIEAVIWRKIRKNATSYLRHVSIVNIAVSLLIANIWFIIGAAISDAEDQNLPACSAATFFIHFFYLALFFWMLASALLLFYHTVSVFDGGLSKRSMLAIGFSLGYGAPLVIAIITVAVTQPKNTYIRKAGVCWLNWDESMALLAFVIPALSIVAINLVILLVVMYKMLKRRVVGIAAQAAERHVLVVIARSLAVLTPFFGITWGLGVGTMTDPYNRGIHISFAFFNSLQGFFILVFGTLLDKKVRSEITIKTQTSSGTRTTSAATSSSSGLGFFRNWRRGRDGYNISSSASGASRSFTDT
ncbi:adhesion G protein-coupled receptor F5 isoform X8 [Dicentrarchus labrax]|uniref:adhesion G protein-coupled receptor F5 isoform X6 n=1 Tax=Dicentrarchus labrax TaxID=13489 RepID=UPI0021F69BA3|nr:adhesion G protein-coupled receptor F5 isoform X6 [Dicentrarchus labrax]XP_051265345.1 adhesion G protein-coupled receptor F5 isoform X7 [Dicentrarchus labrax]XP_051265346.1 adhesion G protein-coupled receptor F5 isoform X8 [Dicentrarchus labrax]